MKMVPIFVYFNTCTPLHLETVLVHPIPSLPFKKKTPPRLLGLFQCQIFVACGEREPVQLHFIMGGTKSISGLGHPRK